MSGRYKRIDCKKKKNNKRGFRLWQYDLIRMNFKKHGGERNRQEGDQRQRKKGAWNRRMGGHVDLMNCFLEAVINIKMTLRRLLESWEETYRNG